MPLPFDARPNVLWIYGEDLSPDLACYGTPAVSTPNIDRLASEGIRHTHTFVTAPVCSASRSALITGTWQTHFDAHHHRSNRDRPLRADMKLVTDCFREAGYFTCNSQGPPFDRPGKTDFNFLRERPFDGVDWSERDAGQPFYAQVNITDTHRVFQPDPESPSRRKTWSCRRTTPTIPSPTGTGPSISRASRSWTAGWGRCWRASMRKASPRRRSSSS